MPFDFKKEYREFYLPKSVPSIVTVPPMNYIAFDGKGDPNEEDGEYKSALAALYAAAYTIKMSKLGDHRIDGYFDYVVPPLEGFWRQEGKDGIDYSDKSSFIWTSVIRLPDFVTPEELEWAKLEAEKKKKLDCSGVYFYSYDEGVCVQIMHSGGYDGEPESVRLMDGYAEENGYAADFSDIRRHHEIYLSDPRRVPADKLKTVLRHPVRKK